MLPWQIKRNNIGSGKTLLFSDIETRNITWYNYQDKKDVIV